MPSQSPPFRSRGRTWARVAVLIAFGGGIMAGGVLHAGLTTAFNPTLYGLGGASLLVLLLAGGLSTRRFRDDPETRAPLPGEVYSKRSDPEPEKVPDKANSSSPAKKAPAKRKKRRKSANGKGGKSELDQRLDHINRELQRANVRLGLGEISEEGYNKIVDELKQRRAEVEAKLDRQRRSDG